MGLSPVATHMSCTLVGPVCVLANMHSEHVSKQASASCVCVAYDTDQDGEISFREFIDLFDDQLA